MNKILGGAMSVLLLAAVGCNRGQVTPVEAAGPATEIFGGVKTAPRAERGFVLPSGTSVRVRLEQTIDTKRNRAGDHFRATLDEPLVVGDRVVVPRGTPFEGRVVTSTASGRFKGRAALALTLDSFSLNGVAYDVNTNRSTRVSGAHKKRNWLWIGGGSGAGAAIGAAASGGTGALIGAGAGAAAGTVGAAFTGKRHVTLPVESRVTFTLQSPVPIGT